MIQDELTDRLFCVFGSYRICIPELLETTGGIQVISKPKEAGEA